MPVIRINAHADLPTLHMSPQPAGPALRRACTGKDPVVVLIHGYKYSPTTPATCPHRSLFDPQTGWPAALGFGAGSSQSGLCVAFGWHARGALWAAHRAAKAAGLTLARTLSHLPKGRPVHIIAHSLGSEVALHALHHLPAHSVGRVILLTGASYQSCASSALQSAAGKTARLINVTTRQNDPFDLMFHALVSPGVRGDKPLGRGITAANATNLALDCPHARSRLAALGVALPPCPRRISHWSVYTRPGAMAFYQALMLGDAHLPLDRPTPPAPHPASVRRSLRLPLPPLPRGQKA